MAHALVQSKSLTFSGDIDSFDISFDSLPNAGNAVIVSVGGAAFNGAEDLDLSVADNQGVGNVYSKNVQSTALGQARAQQFGDTNIGATSGTFTITLTFTSTSSENRGFVTIQEWSGLEDAAFDQSAHASSASSSTDAATGASGTLAQADELVIAIAVLVADDPNINMSLPSGHTNAQYVSDTATVGLVAGRISWQSVSSTTAQNISWTHDNESQGGWAAVLGTYKTAAAGITVSLPVVTVASSLAAINPLQNVAVPVITTVLGVQTLTPSSGGLNAALPSVAIASNVIGLVPRRDIPLPLIVITTESGGGLEIINVLSTITITTTVLTQGAGSVIVPLPVVTMSLALQSLPVGGNVSLPQASMILSAQQFHIAQVPPVVSMALAAQGFGLSVGLPIVSMTLNPNTLTPPVISGVSGGLTNTTALTNITGIT